MNEKRGSWYLLTGLIIGLIIGLILSATALPVQYINTDPSTLSDDAKAAYRIMVAQAYLAEGDGGRARARLALLQEVNPAEVVIAQAQSMLAESGNDASARALALLAAAVSEPSLSITPLPMLTPMAAEVIPATPAASGTSSAEITQGPTGTPGATNTPRPTATPQPTLGSPYVMSGEPETICDPLPAVSLLQIIVLDASGQAVPGVRVEISQASGGIETFYTGLYPEVSPGYADYLFLPDAVYTIRIGESGQPVTGLSAPLCGNDAENKPAYGSLRVIFTQP
ncbi:MAG: hypothetical protein CVU42_15390 [Chloroflexi bacterium HGW-Chloroflexi-4]|jgi:hypothetical protein|nr:MAG: hypothetical protein CVU42_15390 [Chloroflexi bacterium HGW-Chloroflexi-4]